ncbi:metallophosphoesterase [Brevibacillus sp. AF8]|uniref:metallophosphoesterase family protein n=1 Tax=Brevibacillus sp. AF8 TaxID=2825881 RepID=UPI001E40D9B7|nr:metallophosphoesterase [Brevibacillus sp. AF8]MCE0453764.1 metallophosphoesterase [Brevibacillus sp. AF8]
MSKGFDLISDVHLDFWVKVENPPHKMIPQIKNFIKAILPETNHNVLVIAGDLGHYNWQNKILIEELKQIYEHILIVAGNHDYYLVSANQEKQYRGKSLNRVIEMKETCSSLTNVHFLDGDIVEIDGINYGGVGMWYDFSYGIKELGYSKEALYSKWWEIMNDSRLIKGLLDKPFTFADEEKKKLDGIIESSDVIITHVGGDWSKADHDLVNSFYYFDGSPYFSKLKGKVWCFGHTHQRSDYEANGCRFVDAALGYPGEGKRRSAVHIQV